MELVCLCRTNKLDCCHSQERNSRFESGAWLTSAITAARTGGKNSGALSAIYLIMNLRISTSADFGCFSVGSCLFTQGVVTYMSPVEVFATRIKIFDQQKVCLIA